MDREDASGETVSVPHEDAEDVDTEALTRVAPRRRIDDRVMMAEIGGALLSSGKEQPVEIGRFTVIDLLGSGSMGSVYRAYDPQLDRRVALKVIAAHAMHAEMSPARLLREATALARLNHPNVVTVYEAGHIGEEVYVAMELVEGVHLGTWMREHPRGTLERQRVALALLCQAARGLAAAHRVGIVHRDFKPANVLVGDDGRVRVADFGLARTQHASLTFERPKGSDRDRFVVNTGTGLIVGTPRYMAPEQRAGKQVDARADQFAFCVAAWEVLFGRHPWRGGEPKGEPSPPPVDAPRAVVELLTRGLEAVAEQRWASMEVVAERLEAAAGEKVRGGRKAWAIALGIAVVGGIAWAGVEASREEVSATTVASPRPMPMPMPTPTPVPTPTPTPTPTTTTTTTSLAVGAGGVVEEEKGVEPAKKVATRAAAPRPTDAKVLAEVRAAAGRGCGDALGPDSVSVDFIITAEGRAALVRTTADARSGCVSEKLRAAKFRVGAERRATLRVSFGS